MNTVQATQLCAQCNLGSLLSGPQAVPGGLLHQIWRITTTQGAFAVKELSSALMQKPGIYDEYRFSERVATDMAAQGIPAVSSLACAGTTLQELEHMTCFVYPWIEGELLPEQSVGPDRARIMGFTLGRMHSLSLHYPEVHPLLWEHFHVDDWDLLTFQASDLGLPWANPVRAALPRLLDWSRWYNEAGATLSQHLLISHRDLGQKNIIWQDARTPRIIDWESAGLTNPTLELMNVALCLAGLQTAEVDAETFTAVVEGYLQSGMVILDPGLEAIHGYMGTWLGWLLFNMRRSLGEAVNSEEERQLGSSETAQTLIILSSLARQHETWASWLDKWR